jgi:hypothetical protein
MSTKYVVMSHRTMKPVTVRDTLDEAIAFVGDILRVNTGDKGIVHSELAMYIEPVENA